MKEFSVKNLKMETRSLYSYEGEKLGFGDTTTPTATTGTDPTNTTITITTTTHIFGVPSAVE
jgi:hypothetical protein